MHSTEHNKFGLILAGIGVFCFVFGTVVACQFCMRWSFADGVVELGPSPERSTEIVRHVRYINQNGIRSGNVPFPEESLPNSARPGDRVHIAYDPNSKNAFVYTFRTGWALPASVSLFGLALAALGFYLYARERATPVGPNAPIAGGLSQ